MTSDLNKNIELISYNNLNLPVQIIIYINGKKHSIDYIYAASGEKRGKIITDSEGVKTTTDYLQGFQYKQEVLQFFPHAEGYVAVVDGKNFQYVYNYADHLGNVRLSYGADPASGQAVVLEENHYYPFGLKHKNYNAQQFEYAENENGVSVVLEEVQRKEYQHKYQGQEWQDELGLNIYFFKFRMSDPALGRFLNVDPLAPTYPHNSTYAFAENNVTSGIDIEGLELSFHLDGSRATAQSGPVPTGGVGGNYTLQELRSLMAKKQAEQDRNMSLIMSGDPRGLPRDQLSMPESNINVARYSSPSMIMADGVLIGAEIMSMDAAVSRGLKGLSMLRKGESVWMANALERGRKIERMLGENLGWNFPTIDKIQDGVATSIKSLDLTAPSYQKGNSVFNTLKGYINKLADFKSATSNNRTITEGIDYTSKALELAVQPGKGTNAQWDQISQAINYALEKNINVTIKFIR